MARAGRGTQCHAWEAHWPFSLEVARGRERSWSHVIGRRCGKYNWRELKDQVLFEKGPERVNYFFSDVQRFNDDRARPRTPVSWFPISHKHMPVLCHLLPPSIRS